MSNALTGDFDVVAEFAIPAANRILAAMHRLERFPHSLALRVDDVHPFDANVVRPSIMATVDAFGDSTVNHHQILPDTLLGQFSAADTSYLTTDPAVNGVGGGLSVGPTAPSSLRGRAQLQIFPPTIEVADASGTNVTVRLQIIARYFPEPQSPPVAEFIRGDLVITAAVQHVVSQSANVVEIDIKANTLQVSFNPTWSSHPLSNADVAGITLLIRNALKTSFLPSNSTLPSSIQHIQFKTLLGGPSAIAVLLNMAGGPGSPASASQVFLGGGDDFAIGAGIEFVRAAFQPTIDRILSQPIDPVSFDVDLLFRTAHVTYTITLNSATIDLQAGKIVFTIHGHAHTGTSWMPDFDFTVRQEFSLAVDGATANLVVGSLSLTTSSWVVNLFKGGAMEAFRNLRDRALDQSNARNSVRHMLSADERLGPFLNSLLTPVRRKPVPQPPGVSLAYTSAEIRSSGIVLHGSLAVPDWPMAHVEFQKIPATSSSGLAAEAGMGVHGPDYSALRSWIPGGTIQRYEWSSQGQSQPFQIDNHRFVYVHPPPAFSDGTPSTTPVSGFVPLCLTVRGERLSSSGQVVAEPVTAQVCGYTSFPIVNGLDFALDGSAPLVALTHSSPQGLVEVTGHASATLRETGSGGPNLIVHFADETSAGQLEFLTHALHESRREDAATAVLVVLNPDRLAKTRHTAGVIYAEEHGGVWERSFGVKAARRPLTLIVGPNGKVAWSHEGALDSPTLAGALRVHLTACAPVRVNLLSSSVRIGQPPPSFLFEYAPGRELTLRKLAGRAVILVFWKSSSQPSIDAVRDLQNRMAKPGGRGTAMLAINDGETRESAKAFAAAHGLSANVVTDPERKISRAYGVHIWPTIVNIDATGVVRGIRYGRSTGGSGEVPVDQRTAAAG